MANTIHGGVGVTVPATPTASSAGHPAAPVAPVPAVAPVAPAHPVVHTPNRPAANPAPLEQAASAANALPQLPAVIQSINAFLRANQRAFVYEIDSKTGKSSVTVINPATGEIIRTIPATEIMSMASNLQQAGLPLAGLLFDEQA
jgi:uncharacterized FlaG/YvyC family protein